MSLQTVTTGASVTPAATAIPRVSTGASVTPFASLGTQYANVSTGALVSPRIQANSGDLANGRYRR